MQEDQRPKMNLNFHKTPWQYMNDFQLSVRLFVCLPARLLVAPTVSQQAAHLLSFFSVYHLSLLHCATLK